jgi:predicted ATPase
MEKSAIVGREKEIESIRKAMDACAHGHGGTYLITGQIGVGKTRLLEEIASMASELNFTVLTGRGLDVNSVPYLPFTDALNAYKKHDDTGYVPIALSMSAEQSRIESVDLAREKGRVLENFTKKILEMEKAKPIMIIIDDLHWVDPASLSLFVYLARNIEGLRVMLIAAYPEEALKEEQNSVFVNTLMQIRAERLATIIELKPLSYDAILQLLAIEFGTWKIPEDIAKVIYEKTEGNPLFVTEFVKTIVEENIYDPTTRTLKVKAEQLKVPSTVQMIINGRLNTLSENAQKILTAASVYGRIFEYDVLEKVLDLGAEAMLDALDELLEKGFVVEVGGENTEKYRFMHNAIYETVYNNIIGMKRKILHKKIGEVLENIRNKDAYFSEIARHYYNAQMYEKAAIYAKRAAEMFAKIYAVESTITYAGMAKECLTKTGNYAGAIDVTVILGDMFLLSGKYDDAMREYEEMKQMAEKINNSEKVGIAITRIGICHHRKGAMNKALEHLTNALEIFEKCGAKKEIATTLRQIGWIYERKGEFEKSLEFVMKSLKLTEELGDEIEIADAYHRVGTTQLSIGLMDEAERNLKRAIEIRKKYNYLKGLADSYNNLGILYHDTGNMDMAVEYYLKAKEIYSKIGDVVGESMMSNNLGIIYHDRGDWEKAKEHYLRDYHTNLKIGNLWGHMISASNLGGLHKEMENYDEAVKYYTEALDYSKRIGEKWIYCTALGSLAEIHAIKGDIEKAKELAESCVIMGKSTGSKETLASVLMTDGIVKRYAKKWDEAEESLTSSKLLYMEMRMKSGVASCDEELAILYAEKGELDKARKFFEDALKVYDELGLVKSAEKIRKEMKKYFSTHN